jgi:hypothetical protein
MDIVARVLIGLLLWPIAYFVSMFMFSIVTGLANGLALLLARLTRRVFGIRGTWVNGAASALGVGSLAKMTAGFCLGLSIFIYAVLPGAETVGAWIAAAAFGAALLVWMPSLFVGSLLSENDDFFAMSDALENPRGY